VERFGRYELVRTIAAGGMAQVYEAEAHDERGGVRRVALKRILPEHAGRRELRRLFFDEAKVAQRLAHPHIVPVLDFGMAEGSEFLVFELIDGLDAEELFRLARLQGIARAGAIARVLADVAAALAHAHERGVVHRDVSPSNVLIGWDGTVKLADFGIALFAERERTRTATGLVRGKASFMAPEQARGETVGAPADLWALGATACAMDTGAVDRGAVAPELAALVDACMAEAPAQRSDAMTIHQRAHEVASALGVPDAEALRALVAPLREEATRPSAFDQALDLCLVAPEDDGREFTVERRVTESRDASEPKPPRPRVALVAAALIGAVLIAAVVVATALQREPSGDSELTSSRAPTVPTNPTTEPTTTLTTSPATTTPATSRTPAPTTTSAPAMAITMAPVAPTPVTPTSASATAVEQRAQRTPEVPREADPRGDVPRDPEAPVDGTPSSGWLRVAGATLLGGRVLVDGRPVGHAPLLRELRVGTHTVEVQDPETGETRATGEVDVRADHRRGAPAILVR